MKRVAGASNTPEPPGADDAARAPTAPLELKFLSLRKQQNIHIDPSKLRNPERSGRMLSEANGSRDALEREEAEENDAEEGGR